MSAALLTGITSALLLEVLAAGLIAVFWRALS